LKVFMPGNKPIETCKMLETLLGKFHYDDGEGQKTRELLTAQEIRQLKEILVLFRNNSPSLLPVVPYFDQSHLRTLTEYPPFVSPNKLPFDTPPIIQL
jgi:type IV secretory pathway TraG/TraD family ATPase VirD4